MLLVIIDKWITNEQVYSLFCFGFVYLFVFYFEGFDYWFYSVILLSKAWNWGQFSRSVFWPFCVGLSQNKDLCLVKTTIKAKIMKLQPTVDLDLALHRKCWLMLGQVLFPWPHFIQRQLSGSIWFQVCHWENISVNRMYRIFIPELLLRIAVKILCIFLKTFWIVYPFLSVKDLILIPSSLFLFTF